MKRPLRMIASLAAAALLTLASATSANADVVITFDNTLSATGTVSYDGAGGALVGNDITFDIVTVENGAPVQLDCTGCLLDFTTGANTFESAALATWGAGGSFVINGTITDPSAGNAVVATGVLLSGTFSGLIPASATIGAGNQIRIVGSGIDQKNADLLAYFGYSQDDFIFASTDVTTTNCDANMNNGFNCNVQEADVVNTQAAVPEPGSLALFGMALLGAGSMVRRRFARRP